MSQRKRSFYDIPVEQSNDDPDDKYNLPRRKIRRRRISVDPGTFVAQTDDGLTYRRRVTKISVKPVIVEIQSSDELQSKHCDSKSPRYLSPTREFLQHNTPVTPPAAPTFMEQRAMDNPTEIAPDNSRKKKVDKGKPALNQPLVIDKLPACIPTSGVRLESGEIEPNGIGERAAYEIVVKHPEKPRTSRGRKKTKVHNSGKDPIVLPEYPDTSDWVPPLDDTQDRTAELVLSSFLKQLTSFETSKALSVYSGEQFAFLWERIDAMSQGFILKSNEKIVKQLDETGPLKKPKIRSNPANDALRVKEMSLKHVIAMTRSERADWDALASRPVDLCSTEASDEPDMNSYIESLGCKEALCPVEYQDIFRKAFTSISIKADASLKAINASAMAFSYSKAVQARVNRSIVRRALEPVQTIVEPKVLVQNILKSG